MKKLLILSVFTVLPLTAMADKYDFNAMIAETHQEKKVLAHDVQKSLKVQKKQAPRARIVVMEESQDVHVAHTKKDMLVFSKEKHQYKKSEKKAFDRLATELSQSEQ